MNLRHIKGAVNITSLDSLKMMIQKKDKTTEFLVYGSSSDLGAVVCLELIKSGYPKVNYLSQGLYDFVWSTANVEDCKTGRNYLTDHEGLY